MNNKYWLAVDLSRPEASLALYQTNPELNLRNFVSIDGNLQHSETILGQIEALLHREKITLTNVNRFIAPLGPGSFTGLRIALATLKAFAISTGGELAVLSTSEARLFAWFNEHKPALETGQRVSVLTHIGTQRLVEALFEVTENLAFSLVHERSFEIAGWESSNLVNRHYVLSDKLDSPNLSVFFESDAKQLALACDRAETTVIARTLSEITELSPVYFGARA